jgi:ATP-binding cassette, subfamily B, bacterial
MKSTPNSNKELAAFIWSFMKRQKAAFLYIGIISFVWSLDITLWPYLFRLLIDGLAMNEAHREMAWAAIKTPVFCGIALWIFIEAGFRSQGFVLSKAFPKLEADIRLAMFDYIQYHSPHYFNEHFAGSLSNKISDMTTQVTLLLQSILTLFFPAIGTLILTLAFFTNIQPLFALILAVWIAIHLFISIKSGKKCDAYEHAHAEARSTLVGKMVDSLQNNFAVNLFYRFPYEFKQIYSSQQDEQKKHMTARRYVEKIRLVLGALTFILGGLCINGLMIYFWFQNTLSTGEVAQIFNTTWNVVMMMWMVGMAIPAFFQSLGLLKQALQVMKDPQDILDAPNAEPLEVKRGEIIFDNVSFHYGERKLFHNKNIHIPGGQKVGLVGYSGAGKSTFVNLILRFYPLEKGRILIDGQDIQTVTLASLRQQIALIPQDPILFHRSIKENIHFGREDATENALFDAAKTAHVDQFVSKMSARYDSVVGERGTKLSGGERQRIAIARAVLAKTPILLLDEATSALDSVTEKYIQDSLEKLMEGKTVIAIAHRLSTLAKMDRILVFDKGKVIEDGSHIELIAREGHYAHMWKMQAGGFMPSNIS